MKKILLMAVLFSSLLEAKEIKKEDLAVKEKEIQQKYEELSKTKQNLQGQLSQVETQLVELQGQYKLLAELKEDKKEDKK